MTDFIANDYDAQMIGLMDNLEAQFKAITVVHANIVFVDVLYKHLVELGMSEDLAKVVAVNAQVSIQGLDMSVENDVNKVTYFAKRFARLMYDASKWEILESFSPVARTSLMAGLSFVYGA